MKKDSIKSTSSSHAYIKTVKNGIKAMVGGAALFTKGIKKGSSTTVDKNGVSGSWKRDMAGGA